MNDKCRISFFVLGYLSLFHPILVPIRFSAMQLVARKSCLAQPNDCYNAATFHYPPCQCTRRSPSTCILVYLLVHSSSLALPTPRLFRRSGWGRPCRGQVRCPAAPTPHLHSGAGEGGWGSAIGIASTLWASASASASASSRRLSGGGVGEGGSGRVCKSQP